MNDNTILLESGTNELEIIEFTMLSRPASSDDALHHFGINVAKVLEVIENPGLQPGKSAQDPCFMGIISLRGQVLPVIDLSVWLGIDREVVEHEVILVTEFNNTTLGFLASGVTQIYRVSWQDVEPPGKYLNSIDRSCVTGIVHLEGHSLLMLDLESFLAAYSTYETDIAQGATGMDGSAYTALVVDDSQLMRKVVSDCLTESHFKVVSASNGEDAWNILRKDREGGQPPRIDIVVSDIEMPRMDGMALTKNIKSDPELKALPVILFSSLITDSLRHKGESVGADLQISKPEFGHLAAKSIELVKAAQGGGATA